MHPGTRVTLAVDANVNNEHEVSVPTNGALWQRGPAARNRPKAARQKMCLMDGKRGPGLPGASCSSSIAVNRPVCVASWEASRAQLSWKPRDWSASYQGRYASGSDYFLLDLLTWVRVPEAPTSLTLAITFISSDHCACQLPRAGTHIATGPQKLEGFRVGSITIVGLSLELEPRHAVQPLSPWVL